ncbi:hypothetical protein P43SY_009295 [Pythium insidiosum]|uniref:Uncharacterized protein n=1 Tax=Pythium insidiosum TaxID=114742 RepID=A0AAD5LZ70_PYTIN|nr:hypothetical protein P43SY_009295 [Pythium insidiosum]
MLGAMDKSRQSQRVVEFQELYRQLERVLYAVEDEIAAAAAETEKASESRPSTASIRAAMADERRKSRAQRLLEAHYDLAELCATNADYKRASDHYARILTWIEAYELRQRAGGAADQAKPDLTPQNKGIALAAAEAAAADEGVPLAFAAVLPALKLNVLTNLSTVSFRTGDEKTAMANVLEAKRALRERSASEEQHSSALTQLEIVATVNYAVLMRSQSRVDDALHAAASALDLIQDASKKGAAKQQREPVDAAVLDAHCTALSPYASDAAELAISSARRDDELVARVLNNLALHDLGRRDLASALSHLLAAFRASLQTQDAHTRAVVQYHIGLVIAQLETTIELPNDDAVRRLSITALDDKATESRALSAKECFAKADALVSGSAAPLAERALAVACGAGHGEAEYYDGDFHTAEAEFTITLQRLKELLREVAPSRSNPWLAAPKTPSGTAVLEELRKLQGFLESYVGNAQLVQGKFELAEAAHQRDLELALETEDIHAQLRALRNLALVYNSTQRYEEAITLWRETVEIAVVLQSKRDLMMGYSGLGTALRELQITDPHAFAALFKAAPDSEPRQIFLRQRALAVELDDKHQQILAQRHLVATYESGGDDLEQRLQECDLLVRWCEQYENLHYRADAYRAMANALTAQLQRLRERGQRFAEAIKVLTHRRNAVSQQWRDTHLRLTAATARMLQPGAATTSGASDQGQRDALADDRHPRPPIARLEVLLRQ